METDFDFGDFTENQNKPGLLLKAWEGMMRTKHYNKLKALASFAVALVASVISWVAIDLLFTPKVWSIVYVFGSSLSIVFGIVVYDWLSTRGSSSQDEVRKE